MTVFDTKRLFSLPEGVIYLDGNSLGPMPKAAPARITRMMEDEWATELIRGWNSAEWFTQPNRLGDRIGRLIGAPEGSVVMGDTLTIKVHQALSAALALRPGRKVILSDTGNFPTDLYMAQGLIAALDQGHRLVTVAPEDVEDAISEEVAVLMLTEVDYRSGRRHDMVRLTAKAQACGALTLWDLAHSAGAIEVDLTAANADFAVGCTYKYLNGGPGAPAFIYVAPRLQEAAPAHLSGWMGHDAPFSFDPDYRPATGISRMRIGTPPVLALTTLEVSMDIWEQVEMAQVRRASQSLTEAFIAGVEARCEDVTLFGPREGQARGSQVSFRHPEGYAVMQALIADGVIGDFRQPDIMRFGFAPLYNDLADVKAAVDMLATILETRAWDRPAFKDRKAVT